MVDPDVAQFVHGLCPFHLGQFARSRQVLVVAGAVVRRAGGISGVYCRCVLFVGMCVDGLVHTLGTVSL